MVEDTGFLKKLREHKRGWGDPSNERIRDAWLGELERLLQRLQDWLAPAEKEELLATALGKCAVEEERLGQYEAPHLQVRLPSGEEVHIAPIARIVIGYEGRVDMTRGSRRKSLFKKPQDWVVLWGRSPLAEEPLTPDSFQRALLDLLPELE